MGDLDASLNAYQHAVRHNRSSVEAHTRIAAIARGREELTEVRPCLLFLHSIADERFVERHAKRGLSIMAVLAPSGSLLAIQF